MEAGAGDRNTVRVAAAGDLHCRPAAKQRTLAAFASLEDRADLVLLAGDLTAHGLPEEAEVLAEAAAATRVPAFAVLGNHDLHAGREAEIEGLLEEAGVTVLTGAACVRTIAGQEVGIVGTKGFVGGFAPRHIPDFGERSLRAVYAETTAEVDALERGLHEIDTCPVRLVVLHYAPIEETLEGEPPEIFMLLGSDRLAAPILEHGPDLVVHGHAHYGTHDGRIGETPVFNVSQPVLEGDFRHFTLTGRPAGPIR